jgi:hypothetical protein
MDDHTSITTLWILGKTGRISVFPVFTVPPSSPVCFSRIFPIFTDFYRIFQKPTGSVTSDFPCSADFLNTAQHEARRTMRAAHQHMGLDVNAAHLLLSPLSKRS